MPFLRTFALLLCALLAGCSKPEAPDTAAARFFALCAQGKLDDAYHSAATRFQLERSIRYFEARVRELGLDHDLHPEWSETARRNGTVTLEGKFKIPAAEERPEQVVPLSVLLSEENGAWRVLEVRQTKGTAAGEDIFQVKPRQQDGGMALDAKTFLEPVMALVIPTEEQLRTLAEETILKFDASIKAGDFKGFYNFVSERWRFRGKDPGREGMSKIDLDNRDDRLTVTALTNRFGKFIELHADLSPIKGRKMILEQPAFITSAGVLTLNGSFEGQVFLGTEPPTPRHLKFQLQYVMESTSWRVFGISLSMVE